MRLPSLRTGSSLTTLAITSGKGGVGKTSVVVNLALALAAMNRRVLILDADFGLGNVDVSLGLTPSAHLGDVLSGECAVRDVLVEGPMGVQILPAASGSIDLTDLTPAQWSRLDAALQGLRGDFDLLLIDTAAGVSTNVVDLLVCSKQVLVVTSPEPSAVVDAYAVVKILHLSQASQEIGVLVNNVSGSYEASLVFQQLDVAAWRFLGRRLTSYGFVVHDPEIRETVSMQRAVMFDRPHAAASRCFRRLATRVAGTQSGGGRLKLVPPNSPDNSSETEAPQCM